MIAKALTAAVKGINSQIVTVEADLVTGMPVFDIVGLPDSAVKESKERVKAALRNNGINIQNRRITVNLAPGDLKKEGTLFDLPIALAVICTNGDMPVNVLENYVFIGELSLDGSINAVKGVLSTVYEAQGSNIGNCIVPYENRAEASLIEGINIFPAKNLREVINHLLGTSRIECIKTTGKEAFNSLSKRITSDFGDVKGQEPIKRAFAIAAAGQHNILVVGPPGVGKTMLAQRLPSIMPPLTFDESIEVTKIFSVKGLIKDKNSLVTERPFRSTHHTLSQTALVGGGSPPVPGEISLAHFGVLFLDEIAEYPRASLEALRQPMEDKQVVISRIAQTVTYPSNFMLVAASNPCPCGYRGVPGKCTCKDNEVSKYMGKISGPMLDRIDMHIEIHPISYDALNDDMNVISSQMLREKVSSAMEMQQKRFSTEHINFNAHMDASMVSKYCKLGEAESKLLEAAYKSLSLSGRAYHRILKLARTIADFDGSESIKKNHITEAIGYRNMDRRLWEKK